MTTPITFTPEMRKEYLKGFTDYVNTTFSGISAKKGNVHDGNFTMDEADMKEFSKKLSEILPMYSTGFFHRHHSKQNST